MSAQGLLPTDMADVIIAVNHAYAPKNEFEYLMDTGIHSFELVNRLFTREKIQVQGGEYISRFVNYRENGTAEFVAPAQVFAPGMVATLKKLTIPWRHAKAHYAVVREEMLACRDPEAMIEVIIPRRISTQVDQALLIETQLWAAPDATSEITPLTIPYYIKPITGAQVTTGTTLDGEFQGQNPTGYLDVAGIDSSDPEYARWRNWNSQASNSSGEYAETDEERLGWTFENLNFEAPANAEELKLPAFNNRRMYTNGTTLRSMWRALRNQNDQVGWELGKGQGAVTFRGVPVKWQKQLDTYNAARGYYPTYLCNFSAMFPVIRAGDYFRQQTFPPSVYQPDVSVTYMDISYNLLCPNRQMVGAVHSYVAAA